LNKTIKSQGALQFECRSELEEYRVQSLFEKEPETIEWINSWNLQTDDQKNPAFYDIGANIGVFSLYAASIHKSLEVLSFEPVSKNFFSLTKNIDLNNFTRVNAFKIAFSNTQKIQNIIIPDLRYGNSGAQLVNESGLGSIDLDTVAVETVLTFTLDGFIKNFSLSPPTFLKIDVDGFETCILQGATETLQSGALKSMMVEFNSVEEYQLWKHELSKLSYTEDYQYDNTIGHSRHRRKKNNSFIKNVFFKRMGAM
jgi:FkbM family methyltransferase